MNTRQGAVLGGAVLAVLAAVMPVRAAWMVHEVPMLPHWTGGAEGADINSNGVICGNGNYVTNASATPFRYDGTTVTELPLLPGAELPIGIATGINASGVICGFSHNANGDAQAVIWVDTTLITLPYPPGANPDSDLRAYDINDAGVVVGYGWSTAGEHLAFYYDNGTSYSLDPYIRAAGLVSPQFAYGVNNRNVICGVADDALAYSVAWTYDIQSNTLTVLGRIGPENCSAVDINNVGQTVGRARVELGGTIIAVTYDNGWYAVDPTAVGLQWGAAINDRGRMVGSIGSSASRLGWYSDGHGDGHMQMIDLAGWTRESVEGINERDQIIGYGRTNTSDPDTRVFILSPPPGDGNHDGEVGLDDYPFFTDCMAGPNATPAPILPGRSAADCLHDFDFDADEDVDLADFAAFP